MNHHYVYIILDCETFEPVYVGKGKLERAYRQLFNVNGKERMGSYYENGGDPISLLVFHSERISESDAYSIERNLICDFKEKGLYLSNKMVYSPHTKTEEWKLKIREANKKRFAERDNSDRQDDNAPNAKKCLFIPTGKVYGSMSRLCKDNNLNYSSVRSALWSNPKSKYHNLIQKL
jgi:hypothetical protein